MRGNMGLPVTIVVPSLVALCVNALAPYVDQAYALPVRLRLRSPLLIDHLVPDHLRLDPRLWATIVQVFDPPLPPAFASHTLPLLHPHQHLLQAIPSTSNFSLITVLFLPGCVHLTDATIHHLKTLHTLSAFDASNTSLSDYAIQTLAATLFLNEEDGDLSGRKHSGPWALRILALRNCKQITNRVFDDLDKFPLLSVLDLRGTLCSPNAAKAFYPFSDADLYYPSSLATALATLHQLQPSIYSSSHFYLLNVSTFRPPRPASQSSTITPQDAFVVIPSHNSRIKVGNTVILERQTLEREDALRHEINKEAWYDRQAILESRQYDLEEVTARIRKPKSQQFKSKSSVRSGREGRALTLPTSFSLRVSPLNPQTQQVGTSISSRIPSKTHTPLPRQPTTTSEFMDTTYSQTNPAGYLVHSLTEVSALPPSAQLGTLRQRYPLPRTSTLERPAVSEAPSAGSGRPTALCEVGSRSLATAVQKQGNQNFDLSADSTAQHPNAVSSNHFHQPLPRLRRHGRPTSVSPALRGHLSDSSIPTGSSRCKDDLLMLYRDPPVWSALNEAITLRRSEEAVSSQRREWQRMKPVNEMAVVDMNSAKAKRLRQRLGEFVEREVSKKQDNCEHESDSKPHFWSPTPADPPIFVPVQPSQSRNPFKKHPVQIDLSENLMSKPTASAKLIPISAIKIPVPPLGIRKAALSRENGASGQAGASASKKLKTGNGPLIPEMTKEARGQALPATRPRRERPSAGPSFDWKSWGKPC